MPQTLQAESKTKRFVNLGRAIFKRQSGSNTIAARSQRFLRASKARGIWKSGMKKARTQWGKVLKSKKARRESTFDDMYPVGHVPSQFFNDLVLDNTPLQSPHAVRDEGNRHSSSPSIAVTTPTPSNSQRDQGKRQSRLVVHEVKDEPSPLFTRPSQRGGRSGVISFVHPVVSHVVSSSPTPASTLDHDSRRDSGSEIAWSRTNSKTGNSSEWTSAATTPNTADFPGQVNPTEVAERRKTIDGRRFSHDMLDGHRSDRRRLPSQIGSPARPMSVPPRTPSALRPGSVLPTHFEEPEPSPIAPFTPMKTFEKRPGLQHLTYTGTMDDLTRRLSKITGDDNDSQQAGVEDALAALNGEAPARKASDVTEWEYKAALSHGRNSVYPGQGVYNPYLSFNPEKEQKPLPAPAVGNGFSRPTTPSPLRSHPTGKQAADPAVQKNIEEDRRKADARARRISTRIEKGMLYTPSSDGFPSPIPAKLSAKLQSSSIRRKPVSGRKANTNKPLPQPPAVRDSESFKAPPQPQIQAAPAAVHHRDCHCPDCPQSAPVVPFPQTQPVARRDASANRISILEQRIAQLESQLVTRPPVTAAAAGARAAASLHSAIVSGSAVPRGPHRARQSKRKNIHDMSRRDDGPTAGTVLRDVMTITKNAMRKK